MHSVSPFCAMLAFLTFPHPLPDPWEHPPVPQLNIKSGNHDSSSFFKKTPFQWFFIDFTPLFFAKSMTKLG